MKPAPAGLSWKGPRSTVSIQEEAAVSGAPTKQGASCCRVRRKTPCPAPSPATQRALWDPEGIQVHLQCCLGVPGGVSLKSFGGLLGGFLGVSLSFLEGSLK